MYAMKYQHEPAHCGIVLRSISPLSVVIQSLAFDKAGLPSAENL
jgi:hypothetical protein